MNKISCSMCGGPISSEKANSCFKCSVVLARLGGKCKNCNGPCHKTAKICPSMFTMTHYALPTPKQLDEFQEYPNLSADDIYQGFGYTIVGRGVSSPDNCQKIIESIKMLATKYPERKAYKEALLKAEESAKIKLDKWQKGVVFP